jgi:hypothetical protein
MSLEGRITRVNGLKITTPSARILLHLVKAWNSFIAFPSSINPST